MSPPLLYFEVDPPSEPAGVVLAYWGFEVRAGAPATHTLWPDAGMSVVWGMHEGNTVVLTVMGARTEPVAVPVQPGLAFRGIRFWADAARAICEIDPRRARNERLQIQMLGGLGERLLAATRDAATLSDAVGIFGTAIGASPTTGAIDLLVRQALVMIDAHLDRAIGAVARGLGMSDRQLRRRFGDTTGLSPKEYARIRRLRQTLGRVIGGGNSPWSTIAARSGFADQPHLVNEIVRMTAYTPKLLEQRLRLIEHVDVKP
ncbi:MAG: helix-turn-helix domain-containing protein [Gemmatimonadaceae bacterium]